MATAQPLVSLRNITKGYPEGDRRRVVLADLDFRIERGEFVVLLGRSGSGKSTLLNIISGIDLPDSGSVTIGERRLTDLTERERTLFRRRHIGFVFQSLNLIPTLTVEENVLLPLDLNGRLDATERSRALQFLDKVGLVDRSESYPDRLSGGEQQRVAIARALAHDPLLLLADEPTGNLDYHTGRQVMEQLYTLVREAGMTILIVTHDQDLIEMADHVFFLQEGKLVEKSKAA